MHPAARTFFFAQTQAFLDTFATESMQALHDDEGLFHVSEAYGAAEQCIERIKRLFANDFVRLAGFSLGIVKRQIGDVNWFFISGKLVVVGCRLCCFLLRVALKRRVRFCHGCW